MGVALHSLLKKHSGEAVVFFFVSTAFYLASSSNGMLDRAKDALKRASEWLKQAKQAAVGALSPHGEAVPIRIND